VLAKISVLGGSDGGMVAAPTVSPEMLARISVLGGRGGVREVTPAVSPVMRISGGG